MPFPVHLSACLLQISDCPFVSEPEEHLLSMLQFVDAFYMVFPVRSLQQQLLQLVLRHLDNHRASKLIIQSVDRPIRPEVFISYVRNV